MTSASFRSIRQAFLNMLLCFNSSSFSMICFTIWPSMLSPFFFCLLFFFTLHYTHLSEHRLCMSQVVCVKEEETIKQKYLIGPKTYKNDYFYESYDKIIWCCCSKLTVFRALYLPVSRLQPMVELLRPTCPQCPTLAQPQTRDSHAHWQMHISSISLFMEPFMLFIYYSSFYERFCTIFFVNKRR